VTRSLQYRLSVWLCLVVGLAALVGGTFSFVAAYQEAIELQDSQLLQVAALLARQGAPGADVPIPAAPRAEDEDPEMQLAVRFLRPDGADGTAQGGAAGVGLAGLSHGLPDGLATVALGGVSWRVCVKSLAAGPGGRVAVGQQTALRDETALDSALRTVAPLLLLIPVLLLLVHGLTRRVLGPLRRAAAELDRRGEGDLAEVAGTGLPSEVRPFVAAINGLLRRVEEAVALRQRFVADAAHELRSPLTALSLQAEGLEAAEMSAGARERLAELRRGIRRTRGLLDQLLTRLRVQARPDAPLREESLQAVFRRVLEDLLPLAEARCIDVGVPDPPPDAGPGARGDGADYRVAARGEDLLLLVRNLLDNAIRYTPDGGRIDLCARREADAVVLRIDDTGPGIPDAERERVFDPFYRIPGSAQPGSGLGLSIVRAIAERMGARIELAHADEAARTGLSVRVRFPAPSASPDGPGGV
jgi:two-component system OmpR family sensor kinase